MGIIYFGLWFQGCQSIMIGGPRYFTLRNSKDSQGRTDTPLIASLSLLYAVYVLAGDLSSFSLWCPLPQIEQVSRLRSQVRD